VLELSGAILEARFNDWREVRRMKNEVKQLRDNFIFCGFGRMGKTVCRALASKDLAFVVMDRSLEVVEELKSLGYRWVHGDSTEDQTLADAGVEHARGLETVLPSDVENVYVVLSARILAPKMQIIARASDERGTAKLERAGADRIVSVYAAGAAKVPQFLIHPHLHEFLEVVSTRGSEVDMAEVYVPDETAYVGQTLAETDFRERGLIIVGIRLPQGDLLLPPPADHRLEAGDCLIVAGKADAVAALLQRV
jgi:voltage-gated potassium channel